MYVENFSKFIKYYGQGRRIKLVGFLFLSLLAGFLELLGVALISPFIILVLQPKIIINTRHYLEFTNFFHLHNHMFAALILGGIILSLFILKNLFMIAFLRIQNKFIFEWKNDVNKKFMHYYLYSPFKESFNSSVSEKIYNLTYLTNQVFDGFVIRIMNLITNVIIVSALVLLLFTKFLFAAIVASVFVFVSITSQNNGLKNKLIEIGHKLSYYSSKNNKSINENIRDIKEIKIASGEDYFYQQFVQIQKKNSEILSESIFYQSIPPYVIESLVVFALMVLAGIISLQNIGNASLMMASYAVIAAAVFRIAPALNRIQTSLNSINSSRDFAKTLIKRYEEMKLSYVEEKTDFQINFQVSLKLENVSFAYKKDYVIHELNLDIKKGEFVGIIGLSGAGKSTLAEILMGLLPVDYGKIYVDNIEISTNMLNALRRLISYVPQQVNIVDGTYKQNVAFGIEESEIDDKKVVDALKKSQLFEFIGKASEGINSMISSTSLSQGQRQRLAIARALYRDSDILILDEATSSLDVETENEITEMLNKVRGEKTIVAIAHRLSTLKSCDRLIYLKDGRLIDTGTFKDLSSKYPEFERLINLSKVDINED